MDPKYVAKQVALTKGNYELLDKFRRRVEREVGFKVSLAQAIVYAVTTVDKVLDKQESKSAVVEPELNPLVNTDRPFDRPW